MADLSQKKAAYVRKYLTAIDTFLVALNELANLKAEWDADAYATGAQPAANNISDAEIEPVAPWVSAQSLNSAIGAVEAVREAVASQRGYLEQIRP